MYMMHLFSFIPRGVLSFDPDFYQFHGQLDFLSIKETFNAQLVRHHVHRSTNQISAARRATRARLYKTRVLAMLVAALLVRRVAALYHIAIQDIPAAQQTKVEAVAYLDMLVMAKDVFKNRRPLFPVLHLVSRVRTHRRR